MVQEGCLYSTSAFLEQVEEIRAELQERAQDRDTLHKASREISDMTALALLQAHRGDLTAAANDLSSAVALLLQHSTGPGALGTDLRSGTLQHAATSVATCQLFFQFVKSGSLGPRPESPPLDDVEWLGGLLTVPHEIGRYATRRATAGDAKSVGAARDAIAELHASLLLFDFRNGPLRKSYDGVKYVLRRLEDTVYECSLFPAEGDGAAQPNAPQGSSLPLLDTASLDAVRLTMEAQDEARELAIKRCREVQKLAKLAIYSLQRGDTARASEQLGSATRLATDILDEVARGPMPSLRHAGFVVGMIEDSAPRGLVLRYTHT